MIIHDCDQNSEEWISARLGIPTASAFDKIITATGKASTQADTYLRKLLAERITGKPTDNYSNAAMERGHEVEGEARKFYEFDRDCEVRRVGLIYPNGKKEFSCSPDGLIGEHGGLEIKCPEAHTHIDYLISDKVPTKYVVQVQANLWITGRQWWDFMSYHPDMPEFIVRVKPDEEFIKLMGDALTKFLKKLYQKEKVLTDKGIKKAA